MAIKKFKVMASNAKKKAKSDGSCIPKSMRKNVKSGCTKKSVKASDSYEPRPNGYTRDERFALAGDVLYRSGVASNKHGAALAYYLPGDYVLTFGSQPNEMQSQDLIFTIWNPNAKDEFDYAGIIYTDLGSANRGNDYSEALFNKGAGSLGERKEFNSEGGFKKAMNWILKQVGKKSVKSSIKATTELNDFYNVIYDMNGTWENPTTGWVGKCEIYQRDIDDGSYLFSLVFGDNESEPDEILFVPSEDKFTIYPNSGMPRFANSLSEFKRELKQEYSYLRKVSDSVTSAEKSVKSSKSLTVPKSKRKSVKASKTSDISIKEFNNKYGDEWEIKAVDTDSPYYEDYHFQLYHIADSRKAPNASFMTTSEAEDYIAKFNKDRSRWENVEFSTSVKKFGVKASRTAKRIAKSRISAGINSPDTEGPLCVCEYCLEAIESHEGRQVVYDEISEFDIEPEDKLICDWCEEESDRLYQISPDEVNSAKSIKCTQGDFTDDFSEDEFPFRVTSYYDHSQRGIADGASFDDMDEAVAYAHEKLSDGPVRIEHYDVGAVDINPDEYWENFDGEFWCTPELAEWRDEVWKSMGIGASKSIKCSDADGIADEWEDIREIANQDSYEYDGYEDSDVLEYVDSFLQDASSGAWLSTDHVVYNGPDDWEVSAGLSPEAVESDFWFFLDDVDHDLYENMLKSELANPFDEDSINYTYNQNAINGNEFYIQLYPNNNQVYAPQIEFDDKYLTPEWLDRLVEIRKQYEESRKAAYTEFQNGLGEFLANDITASTDIKCADSLNMQAKNHYKDWILRGYKFDGEDVTTLRIDFQDDVKKAVADMFSDPDIETVDLYMIATDQDTTGVFEDEEYLNTITREYFESNVDIISAIAVGDDSKMDFSNPIYELDDYIKALADGVINQISDITYDLSKETIAFFDTDNNIVFVQPIGGIIPEPEDLETDIDELSAAIRSEMDRSYAEVNWEQDEDDPDYASRAVELSEDIGEVDIDDLEPITGDDDEENVDWGFGFDSNGDPIDESTVEELYRIAEYEILPKSELAKIDEYVSIDEDSWDFYMSSPYVGESYTIRFRISTDDLDMMSFVLPDAMFVYDYGSFGAKSDELEFYIYADDGEVDHVELVRPTIKDIEDGKYDVEKLEAYIAELAKSTVKDIYNGTTNL